MTAPMDIKEAAKVLREHNEWRRRGSMDRMPHSAQAIGHAIDAAVAALEELKGARLALSAAKTALAAKDADYALQSQRWNLLQEKARTLDSERQANAILTEENDRLRERLEGMASAKPVGWRPGTMNTTAHYSCGEPSLTDVLYWRDIGVDLELVYAAPQAAYCCAKCGLPEMRNG